MFKKIGIATGISISLLVAGAASAAADDADRDRVIFTNEHITVTREGDWTRYEYAKALGGELVFRTYHGTALDGGCRFSGSETLSADDDEQVVHEERQIGLNTVDCILETETGISNDTTDEDQKGSTYATEVAVPVYERVSALSAVGPGVVALASTTKSGWQKTYYEDFATIDLNSSKVNLTWTYNGSCVTSMSNNTTSYGWLSATGWSKVSSATTSSRVCGEAYTRSTSEFLNGVFCGTVDTRTKYWPNKFSGHEDGTRTLYWVADAWGGCSGTVTFHRSYN